MAEHPGKLCETTESDGDHIWNGSGMIKNLAVALKPKDLARLKLGYKISKGYL